ncbi:hypothetical protein ROZALSC1DRAFT_27029 [Rozella allomycis CSF55]|uniref:Uncharacterized protein n=1 Tax=Rozella allomycis (strain CSF55) TaxID=988480 RepID=A0A4P9YPM5_ROZAC|nr:hypothetical protein ROZALSC1DRAFT_27029 [Rozella allomycis CSF55]
MSRDIIKFRSAQDEEWWDGRSGRIGDSDFPANFAIQLFTLHLKNPNANTKSGILDTTKKCKVLFNYLNIRLMTLMKDLEESDFLVNVIVDTELWWKGENYRTKNSDFEVRALYSYDKHNVLQEKIDNDPDGSWYLYGLNKRTGNAGEFPRAYCERIDK